VHACGALASINDDLLITLVGSFSTPHLGDAGGRGQRPVLRDWSHQTPRSMKKLLNAAAIATLTLGVAPAQADITHKIRLSGQGDVFVSGGSNTYAVVTQRDDYSITVYHTTLKSNYWTGAGVWYDHETTASRACPAVVTGWDQPANCIEGKGGTIQLPPGAKLADYTIEIKYVENGAEQYAKFRIN